GQAEVADSGNPRALHGAARGKIEDACNGGWLVLFVRLPLGMEDVALPRKTSMGEESPASGGYSRSAACGSSRGAPIHVCKSRGTGTPAPAPAAAGGQSCPAELSQGRV